MLLTTTDGLIEDQTSVALSADGKTLYYCTNAKDIERRHIWAVPVGRRHAAAGHDRRRIETYPAPLASGKHAGDAQRRLEDAAVARHRGRWRRRRRRRDAEDRFPDVAQGLSDWTRT